ncbi:MAG: sulfatase [bacterium]|nr:sulfatase [bacterium]
MHVPLRRILPVLVSLAPLAAQQTERPTNVLILLADDLGYMDVGFQNPDTFYETPNLDALAASGVQFTQAYAACPVCSPTRASLMTGRYPARMATTDFFGAAQPDAILAAAGTKRLRRFQKLPLLPAPYVAHLPLEEVTLAEALKEAGYATFFAGKWHLGGEGHTPNDQGFDVNVAGHHRGGPYGRGKYFHPFDMPGLESKEGDHLPARLAEETVRFIREHKDEPFFAMLSFYSVHTPLMGRPDLVEKYKAKKAKLGLEAQWGKEGERKVREVQEHAVYAAMVEAMDEAAGAVLDALDELGLAGDTLVVFFSDNGGLSTSEGHPTSNLPLRAGKGWLYEGGVREPCAIRWPGHAKAGTECATPIVSTDVFPTVLEALGLDARPEQHLDGTSLVPLLAGRGEPERDAIFWHYPHWGNQGGWPGSAIRAGDWKLIDFFGDRPSELYDLAGDAGEQTDRAADEPEIATRLEARLAAWRKDIGAREPRANPLLASEDDE